MYTDPRGGHNRKKVNTNFFKKWSPQMAYVLGLIFADGTLIDAKKSSRTCYLQISNNDKDLLKKVKEVLSSKHTLEYRPPKIRLFRNGEYFCQENHCLRIGNKEMFNDLSKLGLTPRKSRTMNLPTIPEKLFNFFLRGYFDGDGCIYLKRSNTKKFINLQIIFTSGSLSFLKSLNEVLSYRLNINIKRIYENSGVFRLKYRKREGLKILRFIYKNIEAAPYLRKKYYIYQNALFSNPQSLASNFQT